MADQPSLTVLGGPLGGRRFAFEDGSESVLIGSDPSCTFRLELPGISPIHARVRMEDGVILVYDTQSPRGLFVNDDRVTTQMPLRNGDVLWLGTPGEPGVVMIQCRVPPTAGAATASAAASANPPTEAATDTTQAVSADEAAMYVEPIVEPEPTVAMAPPPSEPEAATLIQAAPGEGADSFFGEDDATQSMPAPAPPPPPAPAVPAWSASDDQLPTSFSVEPPTLMSSPAPAPLQFDDEDAGQGATAIMPPFVGGDASPEPEPPPPPAPPPPVAKPAAPPPPRPATPSAPRPVKPAGPPSMRMDRKPGSASMPPRPASTPRRPAAGGGGGGKMAVVAGGALVAVLVLVGAGWFFFLRPKPGDGQQTQALTPVPTTAATAKPATPAAVVTEAPTAAATSEPTPVEVVTMVNPTAAQTAAPTTAPTAAATTAAPTAATPRAATPRATATTKAATTAPATPNPAALASAARDQGDHALAAGQFDVAIGHYDEALRLAPGHADAAAGRAKAVAARDAGKRRFVPGTTSVKSAKQGKADLTGFESSDVKVAGALEYSGRIDFEVKPDRVKPGDPYTIRVFLTNDGKKELKIGSVTVSYVANGNKSGGPVNARAKQVAPQANVLLEEFPGVWGEGTTSWSMEVVIASNRGDTFRNQLTWK